MKRYSLFFLISGLLFAKCIKAQFSDPKDHYTRGKQAMASKNYVLAKDNFQKCVALSTTNGRSGGVVHDKYCQCGGNEYLQCPDCDVFGYEQLYYPENKRVLCRTCGGTRKLPCPYGKYVTPQAASVADYGVKSYQQLAAIYFTEENYERSASYYDKYINAVNWKEIDSKTWYNKGFCENALSQYSAAERSLTSAILIDPYDADIYLERAYSNLQTNNADDAIWDYRAAMRLNHALKYESLSGIGSVYYFNDNYDSALIYLEKAVQLKKEAIIYYRLGYCYNEKERFTEASKIFKLVIQLAPDNYNAYTLLGYDYYMFKQYDAAMTQYVFAMKKDPENELVRYYAGLLYAKKGDQQNLQKMIDELTALQSKDYVQELTALKK